MARKIFPTKSKLTADAISSFTNKGKFQLQRKVACLGRHPLSLGKNAKLYWDLPSGALCYCATCVFKCASAEGTLYCRQSDAEVFCGQLLQLVSWPFPWFQSNYADRPCHKIQSHRQLEPWNRNFRDVTGFAPPPCRSLLTVRPHYGLAQSVSRLHQIGLVLHHHNSFAWHILRTRDESRNRISLFASVVKRSLETRCSWWGK